jgi:hypothetical protein
LQSLGFSSWIFLPETAEIHSVLALLLRFTYGEAVERPSAVDHQVTEDGWVILTFMNSDPPGRVPHLRHQPWEPSGQVPARVVGQLGVHFAREDPDDPSSPLGAMDQVDLYLPGGLTPTDIRRFPWARWLEVADVMARLPDPQGDPSWFQPEPRASTAGGKLKRAIYAEAGVKINLRGRPGRTGHGSEFYEEVAKRYTELMKAGVRSPTKTIAQERNYSRDTVAGWVRRARELNYLPKARKGRAG